MHISVSFRFFLLPVSKQFISHTALDTLSLYNYITYPVNRGPEQPHVLTAPQVSTVCPEMAAETRLETNLLLSEIGKAVYIRTFL